MTQMHPMPLVLLPGMDGTGVLFKPLIAALPGTIRPIVVRYPGDRVLSYDELLPIALASLPIDGAYIILGESFSGPLAVRIAGMRHRGLAGLILAATFITRPWKLIRPMVCALARTPIVRCALPMEQLAARLLRFRSAEHRALSEEMGRLITPAVIAARLRMVFDANVIDEFRRCQVPMLYLQARRDLLVPPWNLMRIRQVQPAVRVASFATFHQVLQHEPRGAANAIAAFVEAL